ncbi:glutathione S-transferase [Paraburkholderia sp. Ac-20336]|uniref:glutathione S-transferase family protein n=1 Tax=Paraburkholderia sp. Ac-20336 TaxID=2703886 RepID=UPI0019805218|nr:glutathione S-transferase N-terminal domain-containing protein [Paraburkholderia sp. Ac-20336]MBN3802815.1 glutathione S-transferase [Paraburkholderia sp. Ac-20336]
MSNADAMTLYTADTPNGQKISIFLKEAGIAYRQVNLDLSRGDQHRPDYLAINPNGKIPAVVDHEAGLTIFESGAILTYLSSKTGCLWPGRQREQSTVQQWLHFQIGSIGPMLGQLWWFLHRAETANDEAIARYRKEALRLYGVVNRRLGESAFLALPEYTIADIAAFSWLRTFGELELDVSAFPHVARWLTVIEARPAVIEGLAANRVLSPAADGQSGETRE